MAKPVNAGEGARRLFVLPTAEELARAAAGRLWGIVRERADSLGSLGRAGGARSVIAVALSGGETPRPVYEALASPPYRERFPWDLVHFFQVDERWVPAGDPRSNRQMIEETLLSRAPVPRKNFHPVDTSLPTPAEAARRYEETLRGFFGTPPGAFPRFDAVILGVGRDGHTASLFPGSPALEESVAWVVDAAGGDPPLDRVTLTLPVINAAARAIFVARGKQKAEAVREILSGGAVPAARVLPKRGTVTVLADSPAASRAGGGVAPPRAGRLQARRATILAGDVGGTKTNLALFEPEMRRLVRREMRSFPSRDYPALEAILGEFLSGGPPVESVCLGVAGPVFGGRSRLTNLPWVVDREKARAAAGARRAFLLNDLQATAFAVPFLPPDSVAVLQEGASSPDGTIGVIAAGTGLGEALLVKAGSGWMPVATEGGHVDFAPRGGLQVRLLDRLEALHGRVSVERVLSGPGLEAICRFLVESEGVPGDVALLSGDDAPRAIAREGLAKDSGACREALRLFVSVYGAQAGNLALQVMATGGIYLGGGIAPAILPALAWGEFLDAFRDKGRFREFLEGVPVKVILDDTAALLGAARYALAEGGMS